MNEDTSQRRDWQADDYAAQREQMVANLAEFIRDQRVLDALLQVPRHLFVPEALRRAAYENRALPIGSGQTISQPLMVAIMLQAAEFEGHERVLEVGGGSGYQAALLGQLAREVFAVEILPELARAASSALTQAGTTNVTLIQGDGRQGYAAAAPYDVILVAAAAEEIPTALTQQLADGGRLLMPVGKTQGQTLQRVRKVGGALISEDLGGCVFVPLVEAASSSAQSGPSD